MNEIKLAWRRLALAIILKAIEDACNGDSEAAQWLQQDGADWLVMLGVPFNPARLTARLNDPWNTTRLRAEQQIKSSLQEEKSFLSFLTSD